MKTKKKKKLKCTFKADSSSMISFKKRWKSNKCKYQSTREHPQNRRFDYKGVKLDLTDHKYILNSLYLYNFSLNNF